MTAKRHKAEETVAKICQVDVLNARGKTIAETICSIGMTEVTYYRWRAKFGELKRDQVKCLMKLETENARPRRTVLDLTGNSPTQRGYYVIRNQLFYFKKRYLQ